MNTTLRAALTLTLSLAAMASPAFGAAPASKTLQDLVASIGGNPAQAGSARYAYLNKLDGNLQALAAGEPAHTVHGVTHPSSTFVVKSSSPKAGTTHSGNAKVQLKFKKK
jgi:hypothetical protein